MLALRAIVLSIMKRFFCWVFLAASMIGLAGASVRVDEEVFGTSLGGWSKKDKKAAEYPLSGAVYRTYKPEITPTPEGGIFVSLRIDHVRNWMSSDDHAVLEVTVSPKGAIVSARSTIAFQGVSIASDIILGSNEASKQLAGNEHATAVQIGTDLVANLSAKLLRENIVEPGRVSYPAVLRHNYNLLFQAIRHDDSAEAPPPQAAPVPESPPPAAAPEKPKPAPAAPQPADSPIETKPFR